MGNTQRTLFDEVWKPIPGSSTHEVSDLGRVRHARLGRILKGQINREGYCEVCVKQNGVSKRRRAHQLVLEAFVGPRGPGEVCCHNNHIKTDNRLCNLRWDTEQANRLDSLRREGRVKLTPADVVHIRETCTPGIPGPTSMSSMARRYGLSRSHMRRIIRREKWRHV